MEFDALFDMIVCRSSFICMAISNHVSQLHYCIVLGCHFVPDDLAYAVYGAGAGFPQSWPDLSAGEAHHAAEVATI
jgi:hypothetical protein